ncbi:MAG: protein phosphatase 1 regulatory subunit 42, partial [Planctomycetales bacterium]
LTRPDLATLAQLAPLLAEVETLTHVNLSNSDLQDVTELGDLSRLTALDLSSCPQLTDGRIDELQQALPRCKIQR